ncbi:MAG TPA: enoyl-CoA hydratase, partial [Acidimicrobiales bacterium]|nr:enoyl-CoA hydratase [Acidimicrobiales bacterium]
LVETDGAVAVVTLNRPEARNALNPELIAAVKDAVATLDGRDDIGAIVLTGADPAFCAGVDLKHLAAAPPTAGTAAHEAFEPLPPHRTPVVGAVNGAAVTGGLELALACDFLIASERATFADTHARVGVMPGGGMTVRLPQCVGINRARQMSCTGDFVDARRAYEWGLVNEVVPHDRLLARAREIASAITSTPKAYVREVRALYDAVTALVGDAAWDRQEDWARGWMRDRFDQARLASEREAVVERGSNQQ